MKVKCAIKTACLLGGLSFFTVTLTLIAHAQSCYMAGNTVNCYGGNLGDTCSAASPNCPPFNVNYQGTVTSIGTRTTVTGASGCGLDSVGYPGDCVWVCTITADCTGQQVPVDVDGALNAKPIGNVCPPNCSGCNNGGH
jgi:hypothetical protein